MPERWTTSNARFAREDPWTSVTVPRPPLGDAWAAVGGRRRVVSVLDADPDLGVELEQERQAPARAASRTVLGVLDAGEWSPACESTERGGVQFLVLEGVLMRRVCVEGRCGAELLAAGDLLAPGEPDDLPTGVFAQRSEWLALLPVHLAAIDHGWLKRMAPYPEVTMALLARSVVRARRATQTLAIAQQPRLADRLWLLLWALAGRYGTVHADGVHLELPLTHHALAQLACAQRPSVSTAIARLQERGRLRRYGRTWVLVGEQQATGGWGTGGVERTRTSAR